MFSSDGVALRAPSRGPADDRAGRFAQLQTFDRRGRIPRRQQGDPSAHPIPERLWNWRLHKHTDIENGRCHR